MTFSGWPRTWTSTTPTRKPTSARPSTPPDPVSGGHRLVWLIGQSKHLGRPIPSRSCCSSSQTVWRAAAILVHAPLRACVGPAAERGLGRGRHGRHRLPPRPGGGMRRHPHHRGLQSHRAAPHRLSVTVLTVDAPAVHHLLVTNPRRPTAKGHRRRPRRPPTRNHRRDLRSPAPHGSRSRRSPMAVGMTT
jgi:hypothetical protein